jgi:hypothetical protein
MLHKHGATLGVALVGVVALLQWWLTGVIFLPFNPLLLVFIGLIAVGVWKRIPVFCFSAEVVAWMSLYGTCCMPPHFIERFYGDISDGTASRWMIGNYLALLILIASVRSARASAPKEAEKAAPVEGGADQAP